jgi:two-component system phosphate regulon sensor histidine kinase PhoR
MDMQTQSPEETPIDSALGERQLVKYGQDLARIYISEKQKRENLEIAYQTLNAIFASTPDGLAVLDRHFKIQQVNNAFCALVECASSLMIGQPIEQFLRSDRLRPELNALIFDSDVYNTIELTIETPKKASLELKVARLQSQHLQGWVITIHDQTALKRIEYQKREFISIAAHELRTPLNVISGFASILNEEGLVDAATQQSYLNVIHNHAQRLATIVNELIGFAELNEGYVGSTEMREFSLQKLVQEVVTDLYRQAADKQVNFVIEDIPVPITMFADSSLLYRSLYQIVLNAITFNYEQGTVTIRVIPDDGRVQIDVADTGIGIPKTELDTIFKPFFQVEPHETRRVGGLGLGLPVARGAIAQLGGTIAIESVLNMGTTVHIDLPVEQPRPKDQVSELQAELQKASQQSLAYAHDLRVLYNQLQAINVQLEEANALKANFLGVVSHELRSPFVSIDFALQTFTRYGTQNLVTEQRELLEQLTHNFRDARRMIDNLVAFANLLSKQGRLNLHQMEMNYVVMETVEALLPIAEYRGLTLEYQVPQTLTLQAGDRARISDALWHLVQNAIKFTERGGHITVRATVTGERCTLEVQDTGIGIPAEKQATLWKPFTQLADPLKRGVEGLGIGLAMVKYVAVAHGGDVFMTSEVGHGTTIGFWLPLNSTTGVK